MVRPRLDAVLALKISKVGNSAGLLLPEEALAKLQVKLGDTVFLTEAPDGYRITPYDPAFARQMKLARRSVESPSASLTRFIAYEKSLVGPAQRAE